MQPRSAFIGPSCAVCCAAIYRKEVWARCGSPSFSQTFSAKHGVTTPSWNSLLAQGRSHVGLCSSCGPHRPPCNRKQQLNSIGASWRHRAASIRFGGNAPISSFFRPGPWPQVGADGAAANHHTYMPPGTRLTLVSSYCNAHVNDGLSYTPYYTQDEHRGGRPGRRDSRLA